jgi:hypothetical protein
MSSFLFLAMLIGVAWLCAWSVLPQDGKRPLAWWPFDMRDPAAAPAREEEPGWRGRRPSGEAPEPAAPRARVKSWRDRRQPTDRDRGR